MISKVTKVNKKLTYKAKQCYTAPAKQKKVPVVMCINRGEIATRVYRAAKEQGYKTLGVYSSVDKKSLHRFKADKSVALNFDKSPVAQYLDIDEMIKLAKKHNADIIHPGYGFLAENPMFAKKVDQAGLLYAGPPSNVIDFFGYKVQSKQFAKKHGIPISEGSDGPIDTLEEAREFCEKITYPVMVKATAGGGGRGIRVAHTAGDLEEAFERAKSEALASFDNDEVFIEKYIEQPRHIEVQILADKYGDVVHLFERDCSVQRRNQKVVELAPCSSISEELRKKICDDAVKLCKEAKYQSAGTVEFLIDKKGQHYFMECNTRIQVEHTVTEEVTGIDIVGAQIRIAEGASLKDLGLVQENIQLKGHAIQLRLTTEDAGQNFAPDTGIIENYTHGGGQGIRIDGNAYSGYEISPSYDSLLCKITGRADSFEKCVKKLIREIHETKVSGVKTNSDFLLNVLKHPTFLSGNFNTNFISESPELFHFTPIQDESRKVLNWFAEFAVNQTPKIQGAAFLTKSDSPQAPEIPMEKVIDRPRGWRDQLLKSGPEEFANIIAKEKKILLTDTTLRDAHQSLLMTRMRTTDMLKVSDVIQQTHKDFFSLENWGGATFDVSLRFLHEDPWERLERMREAIPNIPFQMLLRGANAVGYTSYADNIVNKFCEQAVKSGMDIFRVFDSLNYIDNMRLGMDAVGSAGGVIESAICYTGIRDKYTLDYYLNYARQLVDHGTHILCIKDMTGLLKPVDATLLVTSLKKQFPYTPLHVHTHDNAGSAVATILACVDAGADIVDVCTDSMSGVTSQGSMGTVTNILKGHLRDPKIDVNNDYGLNSYWSQVREVYAPFESPERSSFSDTYQHEMPGGQYSNLQFQAKSMGLGNQWERVKTCYMEANQILGDIIKVTPSSKIVGDLAQFMVTNKLTKQDVIDKASSLDFPKSVIEFLQGQIGQPFGGFPEPFRTQVLEAAGLEPIVGRPGESIAPYDFVGKKKVLEDTFGDYLEIKDSDVITAALYPEVFDDYCNFRKKYGHLIDVPTEYLLRPVQQFEHVNLSLKDGSHLFLELVGMGVTDAETGIKPVFFKANGQVRQLDIIDEQKAVEQVSNEKAVSSNDQHVGAPIKSMIVDIKVKVGDQVQQNDVVAVVTAMKMEMTVKAQSNGIVKRIVQIKGANLESGDLIVELE